MEPPYLRASLDRGSPDEVLMDVLRVLADVVGVEGVGEFNLLLETPLVDADAIRKSPIGALRLSTDDLRVSSEVVFRRRREESCSISPPAILLLRLVSGDRAWLSVTDIDVNWETREPLVELDPVTDDREGVIADIEECRWMGLTAATVTGLDDVGR